MKTKKKKVIPPEDEPTVEIVNDEPFVPFDCETTDKLPVLPAEEGLPPAVDVAPATVAESTVATIEERSPGEKTFPSLYDTLPTTFGAILLGGLVVGGVQMVVRRIFEREKKEHKALTQFVTSMFALIVGIWIADKLIAGPSADLLWEQESRDVLIFIKDITLMVFAYYFGVKAQAPKDDD